MKPTRLLLGALLSLGLSTPALAGHCPLDAKAIDQALSRSSLGSSEKQAIQSLRDEGMELHRAGDHRQSEKKLAEAMRRLLGGQLN